MAITRKQLRALRRENFDLFGNEKIAYSFQPAEKAITFDPETFSHNLPSLPELYLLYDHLNARFFGNRLPRVEIKYSDRMLTAGSFIPITNEIRIGRRYHTIFPDDIEDTLAHEMIHIIYPDHGRNFKRIARKWGISLKARDHPSLRTAAKYLYCCPNCGKEYPRRKRLRMASCGTCTKGKEFDPRFKLVLQKKAKSGRIRKHI